MNFHVNTALNHSQQRCSHSNLDVIRMSAETEYRQMLSGGGKL
jgi:hypothetical protein